MNTVQPRDRYGCVKKKVTLRLGLVSPRSMAGQRIAKQQKSASTSIENIESRGLALTLSKVPSRMRQALKLIRCSVSFSGTMCRACRCLNVSVLVAGGSCPRWPYLMASSETWSLSAVGSKSALDPRLQPRPGFAGRGRGRPPLPPLREGRRNQNCSKNKGEQFCSPPLPPLREGEREGRIWPRLSEKTFNLHLSFPVKMRTPLQKPGQADETPSVGRITITI